MYERERGVRVKRYMPRVCTSVLSLFNDSYIYIQDNGVFILNYLLNLYTSLVRPHLEYACQVWDPYTERNIDHLEKVQKYALRICNGTQGMGIFL